MPLDLKREIDEAVESKTRGEREIWLRLLCPRERQLKSKLREAERQEERIKDILACVRVWKHVQVWVMIRRDPFQHCCSDSLITELQNKSSTGAGRSKA